MNTQRLTFAEPTRILPINQSRMIAYADSRQELWSFGGFDPVTFAVNAELWRLDLRQPELGWKRIFAVGAGPAARSDCLWVWDPVREEFIMSGGADDLLSIFTDTWTFKPSTLVWTQKSTATAPLARFPRVGVYDRVRNVVVAFGGFTGAFAHTNSTEEYDPTVPNWSGALAPATAPGVRALHWMAFDQTRGKTILFGGENSGGALQDTWSYPTAGGDWAELESAVKPPARRLHVVAYHPRLRGVLAGLGSAGATSFSDLWLNTADGWRPLYPETPPTAKDLFFGVGVPDLGAVVMIGGQEQGVGPFPPLSKTYVVGRDEEWREPPAGWAWDEDEIDVGVGGVPGATLADPGAVASSVLRRLAPAAWKSISGWRLDASIPTNSQILIMLEVNGAGLWWSGTEWASSDGSASQRNDRDTIAANVGTLPLGDGARVAENLLLVSDNGTANPIAYQIETTGEEAALLPEEPYAPRLVTVRGIVHNEGGGAEAGSRLTFTPSAPFYHGSVRVAAPRSFDVESDGTVEAPVYETQTQGQTMKVALKIGEEDPVENTVEIPDRSPIDLADLLPL